MEQLHAEVFNLFLAIVTLCVGYLTKKAGTYLQDKGAFHQLTANQALVKVVVQAIEQTYHAVGGEEKLAHAKKELIELLQKNKIPLTEKELELLIEASVNEMNKELKKNPIVKE